MARNRDNSFGLVTNFLGQVVVPDNFAIAQGEDVRIANTVLIKRPSLAVVGNHIAIDDYVVITTRFEIGDYIHIAPLVSIIGGANALFKMGHFCTIAAGCRIICAGDEHLGAGLVSPVIPAKYRDNVICAPVIMENFSSLGSNVVVMPGVTIGEGAVVGANSLVKHDIPAWEIWGGSPAVKYIKDRPRKNMEKFAKELGYDL